METPRGSRASRPELDNIVSQLSGINLGQYKKLENQWASALKTDPPGHVTVDIKITTDATGRPTKFEIESVINGEVEPYDFVQ
ncbi:DNA/RNA non-specific endonuclease [Microbacterium sp. SORGH_AS_0888]|uniref:DNA/RNA non-specific endonuclease n=1 Tax=Microbacterium sp. SORGH_AS_0888 TaxID=3041791 RepID=UPI00358FBC51